VTVEGTPVANVVGGIGTSHVPSIGAALDNGKQDSVDWKPIFDGYAPVRQWAGAKRPDVAVIVYNDHGSAFSLDVVPTFAIGAAEVYRPADEGYGPRRIPTVYGDPELSWHLIESLVAEEFDVTICQRLDVDHGLSVPMSIVWGAPEKWPVRIVPIAVNVVQYPTPTARRCFALGRALRRGIESFGADLNVVVIGTGGMSHQLQGERAGHINSEFDQMFLDNISTAPERLTDMSTTDYIRLAGSEGAELIMWLVMRGALDASASEVYRDYHVPASNTAAGIVVLEESRS
jgi:protocatechuate 4,5-dioxygenase, beta chain